jgi:hypothetical protein
MTAPTSSNGKGAVTAAPDQLYIDLEALVRESDNEGIRARWVFGRELLKERIGPQLPRGRLTEVAAAVGTNISEIGERMRFAERYPTDEELRETLTKYSSWNQVRLHAIHNKSVPRAETLKPKQRKNSEGGKANHRLKQERRQHERPQDDLYYMRERVNRAASELEWYDLEGFGWSEWTQELVEDAYDDLVRLQKWTAHALEVTIAHMGDLSRQRRLTLLKDRSVDPSSTENERRTAAHAAERLRARPAIR